MPEMMINIQVLLLVIMHLATVEPNMTKDTELFISNGVPYDSIEHPYLVTLIIVLDRDKVATCTGSLLTELFVLTAAHCTHEKPKNGMKVYLGSIKSNNIRLVKDVYQYPYYKWFRLIGLISGDISLLRLNKPFENVKRFSVIGGDPSEFDNDMELICTAIGFGMLVDEFSGNQFDGYSVTVRIKYGQEACVNAWKYYDVISLWREYLCTVPSVRNICEGDSGGPLVCNGLQYGVASNAYGINDHIDELGCGSDLEQSRHVFVYVYKQWIFNIIRSGSEPNWSPTTTANGMNLLCTVLSMSALYINCNKY